MAGRPHGAEARSEEVKFRITPSGLAALDKARGPLDRSTYLRRLVAQDVKQKGL